MHEYITIIKHRSGAWSKQMFSRNDEPLWKGRISAAEALADIETARENGSMFADGGDTAQSGRKHWGYWN